MVERFSPTQIDQLRRVVAEVVQAEFANVGLSVEDDKEVTAIRKDMYFLRWLREAGNRVAQRVGWLLIAAIASGALFIVKLGLDAYLAMHGRAGGP